MEDLVILLHDMSEQMSKMSSFFLNLSHQMQEIIEQEQTKALVRRGKNAETINGAWDKALPTT